MSELALSFSINQRKKYQLFRFFHILSPILADEGLVLLLFCLFIELCGCNDTTTIALALNLDSLFAVLI